MKYTVFLLALYVLVCEGPAPPCNRQFTSTPTAPDDCSTEAGVPGVTDPDAIPCFVYDTPPLVDPLEYPQPNTRTCYRTCHNAALGTCQASLTGVHNQNINYGVFNPTDTLQTLFSPNYNDNGNYRKSTICRYDVTCPQGMLLSYMFLASHSLEGRTNYCVINNKCVDYVRLNFPASTDEVKVCGQEGQLNHLFADGHSAMSVEFYTNRHEQDVGFSMNVMCNVPGTPSRKRRVPESGVTNNNCSHVSDVERAPVDSAQQLREAFNYSDHAQEDLQNTEQCQQFTIHEFDDLFYISQELILFRRFCEDAEGVTLAENITSLYVSNRFFLNRTFNSSAPMPFQGYAELYVCSQPAQATDTPQSDLPPEQATDTAQSDLSTELATDTPQSDLTIGNVQSDPQQSCGSDYLRVSRKHAYLLQTGIQPESKPTYDEEEVIAKLNQAISRYLVCVNYFDVLDELDDDEDSEDTDCKSHFQRESHLDGLAQQYSNACNLFLRSAACSYRAVIMEEPCAELDSDETFRPQ